MEAFELEAYPTWWPYLDHDQNHLHGFELQDVYDPPSVYL